MIPIVAALVHQVAQKAVAKHVNGAFAAKAKQHQAPQILPHLELEKVELSNADLHRAPAQEVARRLQDSIANGARAAKKLAEDRAESSKVPAGELESMQAQASQLNDQVESLSQLVGKALSELKSPV